MKDFSYITNSHPSFIEGLYQDYLKNPESVDPELKKFFEGFDFAMSQPGAGTVSPGKNLGSNGSTNGTSNGTATEPQAGASIDTASASIDWKKEVGAYRLILGLSQQGSLVAKTNPSDHGKTGAQISTRLLRIYGRGSRQDI